MRKQIFYFTTCAVLFLGANIFTSIVLSQTKPFTIGQILRAIASINQQDSDKDKKILYARILNDISQRKVEFPLTKENEELLRNEGASNEIIEIIRKNSPPLIVSTPTSTPTPKLTPTPIVNLSTPTPTPTLTLTSTPTPTPTPKPSLINLGNVTAGTIHKTILPSGVEMSFAFVPAGEFQMGSKNGDSDEKPVHTVRISQGFWMQTTEVTQAQWQSVMSSNPSFFKDCWQCPVEQVSWDDVQSFVSKLNAQNDGYKYRLPTEAEWEYSARARTTGDYAGNVDLMAWYAANSSGKTHPVGQKSPNLWGLYDMHGNVWEWVHDWYGSYSSETVVDPTGPYSGSDSVVRGGGWFSSFEYLRSAYRNGYWTTNGSSDLGFRVVRQ